MLSVPEIISRPGPDFVNAVAPPLSASVELMVKSPVPVLVNDKVGPAGAFERAAGNGVPTRCR